MKIPSPCVHGWQPNEVLLDDCLIHKMAQINDGQNLKDKKCWGDQHLSKDVTSKPNILEIVSGYIFGLNMSFWEQWTISVEASESKTLSVDYQTSVDANTTSTPTLHVKNRRCLEDVLQNIIHLQNSEISSLWILFELYQVWWMITGINYLIKGLHWFAAAPGFWSPTWLWMHCLGYRKGWKNPWRNGGYTEIHFARKGGCKPTRHEELKAANMSIWFFLDSNEAPPDIAGRCKGIFWEKKQASPTANKDKHWPVKMQFFAHKYPHKPKRVWLMKTCMEPTSPCSPATMSCCRPLAAAWVT